MTYGTRIAGLAVCAALTGTGQAWAQGAFLNAREQRGEERAGLRLDASVFGAFDSLLNPEASAEPDAEPLPIDDRVGSGGGSLQLAFLGAGDALALDASGTTAVRYYPSFVDKYVPSYSASLRLSPGEPQGRGRLAWNAAQDLSYAPSNTSFFFPDGSFAPATDALPIVDYQIADDMQFVSSTSAGVTYGVSRRGSLSGSAGFGLSDAPQAEAAQYRRWNAAATYSYALTRYMGWRTGYGLSESWQSGAAVEARSRSHNLDVGIDYSRPLSFSRRTRVSFSFGGAGVSDRQREIHYTAIGNAGVNHLFGRTWTATGYYNRNVQFVPTFVQPLLSDGLSAGVGGQLSRKSAVQVAVSWSRGTVGVPDVDNGYETTSFSGQYRYALLQRLAAYAEYFYFDSTFDGGVELLGVLARIQRRHGVRIGVSMGLDLFDRR